MEFDVERFHGQIENSVDSILHLGRAVGRFNVNIARPFLQGVEDDGVQQTDDGALIIVDPLDGKNSFPLFALLHENRAKLVLDPCDHLAVPLAFLDRLENRRTRRHDEGQLLLEQLFEMVEGCQVVRGRHGDGQNTFTEMQGSEAVARHPFRQDIRVGLKINLEILKCGIIKTVLLRKYCG